MKKMLAMLLALLTLTGAASAETLVTDWFFPSEIEESFLAEHPEATKGESRMEIYPQTASELAGTMLIRTFDRDVFRTDTKYFLPRELMEKGYVLDLSGSEIIREAVNRMFPALQEQLMRDGKIYAMPWRVELDPSPLCAAPEVWEELGYAEADVPRSFVEFLDFLDAWVARQRQEFQGDYWVFGNMDVTVYDSAYYPLQLTRMLMDDYILQKQYAGEPLTFDEPELLMLLQRAKATGDAIYSIETVKDESLGGFGTALFSEYSVAVEDMDRWHVPQRLHREQPDVITARADLAMVYAGTASPELAIAYVESIAQHNEGMHTASFYVDAEPVINADQADAIRHWSNLIALAEHRLANDHTPYTEYMDLSGWAQSNLDDYAANAAWVWEKSDSEIEESLERWQTYLEQAYATPYLVSPERNAAWARMMETMYFPAPSAFSPATDAGINFTSLIKQYAYGTLSAEQLLQEAARIAWMVEME